MTLEAALQEFKRNAIAHNLATVEGNAREANAAAAKFDKAFEEIKSFGEAGLTQFFELMESNELPVRAMAAGYSLHYVTERALSVLRGVALLDKGILGFSAENAIKRWHEGEWNIR